MANKVQKIREEVEKRFEQIKNSKRESDSGAFYQLKELLEFIDSMQEEPVSEDKMTIRKEWFEHCKKSWYNEGYIDGKYNRDRQFEETVSEELEEAARKIATRHSHISGDTYYANDAWFFKKGAQWEKEQIEEALLSEILPCFMHGGEADEVVAKLDEVLNKSNCN